jgi:hypothetical protein
MSVLSLWKNKIIGSRAHRSLSVTSLVLGTVCNYSAASFRDAVQRVTDEDLSGRIRARAAALSPTFSSKGLASWLWESMSAGQPINNQFQSLMQAEVSV